MKTSNRVSGDRFNHLPVVRTAVSGLLLVALLTASVFANAGSRGDIASERPGAVQSDEGDPNIVLVNAVWERLLAIVPAPAGLTWPPQLHLLSDPEMVAGKMDPRVPNAFATLYKGTPFVCFNKPLLETIIEGNAHRLAFVLGHELSHITLGHVRQAPGGNTILLMTLFTREMELAADRNGIKVALAAGYDFREAMSGPKRFIELGMEQPPLWPASHPSWTQRLGLLEKNRASLWNSMGAFNNGVLFLSVEQYGSAERCFGSVVRAFPDCYEGYTNLGYARLMEYCDLLKPEDVAQLGIAHIMIGAFYRRPDSLIEKGRGINAELWKQATSALEQALRLKPDAALAKASLGIAYLVRPEGKDVDRAGRYLNEAAAAVVKDASFGAIARAAVLVNLSVAELAAGKAYLSDAHLGQALRLAGNVPVVRAAVLYNYAEELLQSGKDNQKREASNALYKYLKIASPSSIWWKLGLDKYSRLCSDAGLHCDTEQQIRAGTNASFRPLPPIPIRPGVQVQLGESIAEVRKQLGPAVSIPIAKEARLNRYRYPKLGIDIIGGDEVIAISLSSSVSPPIRLQTQGPGGQASTLKVGMTEPQVAQLLGPASVEATVFSAAVPFRFYPQLGVAARFANGRLAELLVVILPRQEG